MFYLVNLDKHDALNLTIPNCSQLLSTERANKNRDQLSLQVTVSELQQSLQSEQQAAEGKALIFLLCVVMTCD